MGADSGAAFLATPLPKVLGRTAKALAGLQVVTVEDLLRHYPRRYLERGELTAIAQLRDKEEATVFAEIAKCTVRSMRSRRGSILEVTITDGRDSMVVTFFNQSKRAGQFRPGLRGLFAGEVSSFGKVKQLAHPECVMFPEGVEDDSESTAAFAGALIPIYPSVRGLPSWRIRRALGVLLDQMPDLDDPIPAALRDERDFVDLGAALRLIHRPESADDVERAKRRLRFEEAFVLQAVLAQRRAERALVPATRRAPARSPLVDAFDSRLPFALTAGQLAIAREIDDDLAREHPMHRLLQGEVGSGKTVVALRAMLRAVDAGGQAVLLAPTEVLAHQHFRSVRTLLGPLADRGTLGSSDLAAGVALLTGSQRTAQRRDALLAAASGEAGIVVGTHALLEENVDFFDLALVVVDEQHRFGVEQRAALAAKSRDGSRPHVLVMTATPIPRTLAMTAFGDVEVSTLVELPVGRQPITTHVVAPQENPRAGERVWERVREEAAAGHRVFVVCPRIGDGDQDEDGGEGGAGVAGGAGVVPLAAALSTGELAGLRVGVLHGRMADKDAVLQSLVDGELDVLVATTVIEVGVDIPEATTMVVMDADQFGIAQLHQLRGRVARGSLPALCLLITSAEPGTPARDRVEAVASTTDGFVLAERDLEQRREGDVLGAAQSGTQRSLRLLVVARDGAVIEDARAAVAPLVTADPTYADHPGLGAAVQALRADEQGDFLERA